MAKPTNFDYAFYKEHKPGDLKDDPKTQINMTFLHNHYIHYPKLDVNSTDNKVMYDRVNMIRQMTKGLKETNLSIKNTLKKCNSSKAHVAFKQILKDYQDLLRKAEIDRQNWIKIERGVGNTQHLDEFIFGPGLDDPIHIG